MKRERIEMSELKMHSWLLSPDGFVQVTGLGVLGGNWVEVLRPLMSCSKVYAQNTVALSQGAGEWIKLQGIPLKEDFLVDRLRFKKDDTGILRKYGDELEYEVRFNSPTDVDIYNTDKGLGIEHLHPQFLHQLQLAMASVGIYAFDSIIL